MKKLIAILMAVAMLAAFAVPVLADDYNELNTTPPETEVDYSVSQTYIVTIPATVSLTDGAKDEDITATYNLIPGNTLTVSVTSGIDAGVVTLTNDADSTVTVESAATFTGDGWQGKSDTAVKGYTLSLGAIADGAQAGTYKGTLVFSIAIA